jgi:hypothetical protein
MADYNEELSEIESEVDRLTRQSPSMPWACPRKATARYNPFSFSDH